MYSLKLRVPDPEPEAELRPARGRRGRTQLLRALRAGLLLQAVMTASAVLLTCLLSAPLRRLNGPVVPLALVPDLLGPSWIAGLLIGYVTSRLRWWHAASAGLIAAGFFLICTTLPSAWEAAQPLRGWVAANLVAVPILAGWMGHRCRFRRAR